jgi:formate dehydrogenase accessory protein FdhD
MEPLARVPAWPAAGGEGAEWVAQEVPVALVLNGISQAVMLATPADLEDFALGFAIAESWITGPAELLDVEEHSAPDAPTPGLTLELRTTAAAAARAVERRRTLAGRTGCGLCGVESLELMPRPTRRELPRIELSAEALATAMQGLVAGQVLNARCGGLHAAAWCALDGRVLASREDVGRHNALDKLVGAVLRAGWSRSKGFVATTSRASVELVHKAVTLGAGALATASAPTALAVSTAKEHGLALWAFVREGRATRYA